MLKSAFVPILSIILFNTPSSSLEVGTNCIAITCEIMEGKCCDRSDMELKVTLADNCSKITL